MPIVPVPPPLLTPPEQPTSEQLQATRERWAPEGQRLVVTLTNFNYWGKVEPLLEACPAVEEVLERDNAQWLIAGRGAYLKEFQRRLAGLSAPHAHAPGFVANVWPLLVSADAMLHLSRVEGLPRATLEARAADCPVIVNNFGGMPEAVEHEQTGLIVEEPSEAAAALDRLLSDKELAERLRSQGREYVLKHYTSPVIGRQLVEAIRSCQSEGRTKTAAG